MPFRVAITIAIASVFIVGVAKAQDPADRVTVDYSPSPTPHVTVTNNYPSRLTGMVIVVSSTLAAHGMTGTMWFDPGLNFRNEHPLQAGESLSFPVGPIDQASTLQPRLMAAAFEDLTSVGDPRWLSLLHSRRKAAYDEIGAVTTMLNQALAEHQTKDQIVSGLEGMKDSLKSSIAEGRARVAARLVIATAISNLERGGVRGSIGDPQKTIPLALLPLFAQWRGALKQFDHNLS